MKDISRKISIQRLAYHMSTFDASIRHHFKVTDPTARHFICPLCLEQEILFKDNDFLISESFTLEHLPPESIGGFFKTITCTNCNSRQGTDEKVWQDFAKLNAISYGFPVKPLNIRAHTETSKLHKAWMGVYPNGNRYFDFPTEAKFNNPDLKEMLTRYKDGIEDIKLVITIEQEKLNRALLKSAYLICFLTWGYDFTNSENGERMRNVLKGKDDYPINLPITVNFLKEQIQPQVSIIHEPKELETYCVHIPIRLDNTNIVYTVPIPPPTKNGWKKLERMGRISKRFHEKVLRIIPLRPLKTSEVLGYSSQWTEYLNIKKGLLHS